MFEIPGVIESKTCFLPMITDNTGNYLRLYQHYKNHLLPFSGGILEQPNLFLQVMEILDKA